jgi:hypothetical protein
MVDGQQFVPITITANYIAISSFFFSFKVVCEDNQRPMIPPHWADFEVLDKINQLMKDCWYKTPASRITALRIKKTLGSINSDEKFTHIM